MIAQHVGFARPPVRGCILATGGAGYIGSHVVVELAAAGYKVVILDNFENADRAAAIRIPRLAGGEVVLIEGDVRDAVSVEEILRIHHVDAVIHLAGKKAVGESVANPMLYFRDNLLGAVSLLGAMQAAGVARLIFSSSATVYGVPEVLPVAEDAPVRAVNPYGRTKLMIEEMIDDLAASWPDFRGVSLRYFNPVGAHHSGLIGENPSGVPNNLFPYVAQTAAGERERVRIFGGDYATADGTGVRDYIHVVDLARGHVRAVDHVLGRAMLPEANHAKVNLGTGTGYSVLEVLAAFSAACGFDVPHEIVPRRPGDAAASVADARLAERMLGWHAAHGLDRMCRDHWAFQQAHRERTLAAVPLPAAVAAAALAEPPVAV